MEKPEKAKGPTRVLIIDDHERVRAALLANLGKDRELQVAAAAAATEGALEAALQFEPDVVLLDVKRTDGSGMEICQKIIGAQPGIRVLILTSYPDEREKGEIQALGAAAYLLKDLDLQELLQQIKAPQRSARCMGSPTGLPRESQT